MKGRLILAALGVALLASPATAANLPTGGMTVQEVAAWLQKAGYKAELKGSGEDAYVASATDGVNFEINMYDCEKSRCASVQFQASFNLTDAMSPARANEWNTTKRYAKLYVDSEGDPYLQYDANVSPGGTYEALDDDFGVWRAMLGDFLEFIDW